MAWSDVAKSAGSWVDKNYTLPQTPGAAMFPGASSHYAGQYKSDVKGDGSGINPATNYAKVGALGALMDPRINQGMWSDMYYSDPRIEQAQKGYDEALGAFGDAAGGFNQYANDYLGDTIGDLRNQAYGQGPSYAEQYGAAQRQQAQGDIAKQAAMNARGGMSAADRRAAIMQSSNVGANMAAQIAAARTQERQAAMQQYLQARDAQLKARGMGVEAIGAVNAAQAGRYGMDQTGWGGFTQAGQTTTAQQGNAFWPGPK